MAARKILPFSTFTIFLTLLLLSSRIYCQGNGDEEDCEEDSSEDSSETGNTGPGKGPGSNPGKGSGSDPGKKSGSDPLKELGSDLLKGLGSLSGIDDIAEQLWGILDPAFLKSVVDYGGELVGMLAPILTAITDAIGTVLKDPTSFLSDPAPVLEKLLKGILGPIAGVTQEVAIEIASEGNGIEAELSEVLPEPLSGLLQGPVDKILNVVYGIGFNAADATQGAADLDGGAILKSLGKIGDSVKTLFSSLATLPNDLQSAGG